MGDRTLRVTVTKEEHELLKKIGGNAPRGFRMLLNKGLKSKLTKNILDLFVEDCIIITKNRDDRETLKEVHFAFLEYCKHNNRPPGLTKQQMRMRIEDVYNVAYGRVSPESHGFFGIMLF